MGRKKDGFGDPIGASRRAERKRELEKNKKARAEVRKVALAYKDPAALQEQLDKLRAIPHPDTVLQKRIIELEKAIQICKEGHAKLDAAERARSEMATKVILDGIFGGEGSEDGSGSDGGSEDEEEGSEGSEVEDGIEGAVVVKLDGGEAPKATSSGSSSSGSAGAPKPGAAVGSQHAGDKRPAPSAGSVEAQSSEPARKRPRLHEEGGGGGGGGAHGPPRYPPHPHHQYPGPMPPPGYPPWGFPPHMPPHFPPPVPGVRGGPYPPYPPYPFPPPPHVPYGAMGMPPFPYPSQGMQPSSSVGSAGAGNSYKPPAVGPAPPPLSAPAAPAPPRANISAATRALVPTHLLKKGAGSAPAAAAPSRSDFIGPPMPSEEGPESDAYADEVGASASIGPAPPAHSASTVAVPRPAGIRLLKPGAQVSAGVPAPRPVASATAALMARGAPDPSHAAAAAGIAASGGKKLPSGSLSATSDYEAFMKSVADLVS